MESNLIEITSKQLGELNLEHIAEVEADLKKGDLFYLQTNAGGLGADDRGIALCWH